MGTGLLFVKRDHSNYAGKTGNLQMAMTFLAAYIEISSRMFFASKKKGLKVHSSGPV